MEPCTDSCAKSIQTDRHHPQYPLLWVGTDRQTPIQLKYRLGTRQTWSRAIFSHPTHQIDRSYVGLAFQLPYYSDWLRHYVGRRGSFMFFPHLRASCFHYWLLMLFEYIDMYAACFIAFDSCMLRFEIVCFIGLCSLSCILYITHWIFYILTPPVIMSLLQVTRSYRLEVSCYSAAPVGWWP